MTKEWKRLVLSVLAAALLWFYMFSPWTGGISNFWLNMTVSALVLSCLAVPFSGVFTKKGSLGFRSLLLQVFLGVAMALALWGVFWMGDKISQMILPFARGQVDSVYAIKDGSNPRTVALLLLFLIGPAEEFFWRGYVQKTICKVLGPDFAFIITVAVYGLVHIWSLNFMLVAAAIVAGGFWGLVYRLRPSLLPAIIVSHALWDTLVFVVWPI